MKTLLELTEAVPLCHRVWVAGITGVTGVTGVTGAVSLQTDGCPLQINPVLI